jgi:hypothetical protein
VIETPEDDEKKYRREEFMDRWRTPLLMIFLQLILLAVQWGILAARMDEYGRRLQKLEDAGFVPAGRSVDNLQFQEFRDDVLRRLQDIEKKLDENRGPSH